MAQLTRRSGRVARASTPTGSDARGVSPAARPDDEDVERFRGLKTKPLLAAGNAVLRAIATACCDDT